MLDKKDGTKYYALIEEMFARYSERALAPSKTVDTATPTEIDAQDFKHKFSSIICNMYGQNALSTLGLKRLLRPKNTQLETTYPSDRIEFAIHKINKYVDDYPTIQSIKTLDNQVSKIKP